MTKALPIFGPENPIQNGRLPVVVDPSGHSGALPVWSNTSVPESASVFGPTNTETTAFVFAPTKPHETAAVFCPSVFAEVPPRAPAEFFVSTAAAHEVPKRQGQRQIDRIIREFLKRIKADDIRIRRVGHTTYSWKHPIDPEPSDTGSDVRWEIKLAGSQIHMGVYDIKPFYRVVSGPFEVEKLVEVRKNILAEMDADAGEG